MTTWTETIQASPGRARWMLFFVVIAVAAAVGLIAAQQPLLAVLALSLPLVAVAVIIWPNIATLLMIFILYANIAVVAVRFHGLPYEVGAAFPLLLLAPLAVHLIFRRRPVVLGRPFIFIVLFIGVQLLGVVLARDTMEAVANVFTFIFEGVLIYLLIVNVVRTPAVLRGAIWAMLLAGALISIFPIIQQLTGNFDNNYGGFAQLSEVGFRTGEIGLFGEARQFRLAGAIGEQNRFAQVLLVLMPLGLFTIWSERSAFSRGLALVCTSLIATAFVFTFSRGGAVGFVLLLLVMLLIRAITLRWFLVVVLAATVAIYSVPEYSLRMSTIPGVLDVFDEDKSSEEIDGSFAGRATEMVAAAMVFADHPVAGVGPGMFKYYSREYGNELDIHYLEQDRQAHSLYLDIAANHGFLGLITFFGIFAVLMYDLWAMRQRWRQHPVMAAMASGLLLALVAYLTSGMFLHLSYVRYLWLLLGLAAAAGHISRRRLPTETVDANGRAPRGFN